MAAANRAPVCGVPGASERDNRVAQRWYIDYEIEAHRQLAPQATAGERSDLDDLIRDRRTAGNAAWLALPVATRANRVQSRDLIPDAEQKVTAPIKANDQKARRLLQRLQGPAGSIDRVARRADCEALIDAFNKAAELQAAVVVAHDAFVGAVDAAYNGVRHVGEYARSSRTLAPNEHRRLLDAAVPWQARLEHLVPPSEPTGPAAEHAVPPAEPTDPAAEPAIPSAEPADPPAEHADTPSPHVDHPSGRAEPPSERAEPSSEHAGLPSEDPLPLPARFQIRQDKLDYQERPAHRRRRRRAAILDRADGFLESDTWEGAWDVGEGGMGMAALWIQKDASGLITQRIVRKDTYLSRSDWADARLWHGNFQDDNRRHVEAVCMDNLQHSAVPELFGYCTDIDLLRYTLYMEYCSLGTLSDVIRRHTGTDGASIAIPEPFMWRVLQGLAEVGSYMETGNANGGTTVEPGWQEIVRRDLKPGNIFLTDAEAGQWEVHPKPVVGDFGIAILTSQQDRLNPTIYLDQLHTAGYLAPELIAFVHDDTREPMNRFKVLAKANVWGK